MGALVARLEGSCITLSHRRLTRKHENGPAGRYRAFVPQGAIIYSDRWLLGRCWMKWSAMSGMLRPRPAWKASEQLLSQWREMEADIGGAAARLDTGAGKAVELVDPGMLEIPRPTLQE